MLSGSGKNGKVAFRAEAPGLAVELDGAIMEELLDLCRLASPMETGGILLGRYSKDGRTAEVSEIMGPPDDSIGTRTTFLRGIKGLQNLLDRAWNKSRGYYLGEWHSHPKAVPEPSRIDDNRLWGIASNPSYQCPEPLLLIAGHEMHTKKDCRIYVYRGPRERISLTLAPTKE